VLNLLHDVFHRPQQVTDKEFIAELEQGGDEYTLRRVETATYLEVGRFCYRFNEHGQSGGGWTNKLRGGLEVVMGEMGGPGASIVA
jgi:hypothetical protein